MRLALKTMSADGIEYTWAAVYREDTEICHHHREQNAENEAPL